MIAVLTLVVWQHNVLAEQTAVQEILDDTFANVYVIPDSQRTNLIAYLVFNEGEFHNPGTEGLAHYVEHLAWLNAVDSQDTSRHTNAWTNLYSTGYWIEFDKEDYENQLGKLLRVGEPWALDTEFMLEERSIIKQEYKYRNADADYIAFSRERTEALLGKSAHARSTLGTLESIKTFSLAEASQLHQQSHQLKKATLVVSGDVSAEELSSWLDAFSLPEATSAKVPSASVAGDVGEGRDAIASSAGQSRLDIDTSGAASLVDEKDIATDAIPVSTVYFEKLFKYDSCGSDARCDATFGLLNAILDSSLPGGIANALRYDDFIASSFSMKLYTIDDSHAVVSFNAQPDVGVTLDTLQQTFNNAWSATMSDQIPRESVERVRQRFLGELDRITEESAHALDIAIAQLSVGETVYTPDEQRDAVVAVTYKDVMRLLQNAHAKQGKVVVRRVTAQ